MLMSSLTNALGRLWIDGIPSFVFSGSPPNDQGRSVLNMDQDFIHCVKKLFNPLASGCRTIILGLYALSLSSLIHFLNDVSRAIHGARITDIDRRQMRAMDFPSVLRLTSQKFLDALDGYIKGTNRRPKHDDLVGMHRYLVVINRYTGIFKSKSMSLSNRITGAAYVTTFLLIWQGWVKWHAKDFNARNPGENDQHRDPGSIYITTEAKTDVILSCHFIVLIITVRCLGMIFQT